MPQAMMPLMEQSFPEEIPPSVRLHCITVQSQEELRYVLIQSLVQRSHWKFPIDSLSLMRKLRKKYEK